MELITIFMPASSQGEDMVCIEEMRMVREEAPRWREEDDRDEMETGEAHIGTLLEISSNATQTS